jgi:hypothetical protein
MVSLSNHLLFVIRVAMIQDVALTDLIAVANRSHTLLKLLSGSKNAFLVRGYSCPFVANSYFKRLKSHKLTIPQNLARQRVCLALVLDNDPTVDQDLQDAFRELMRLQEGGLIDDVPGVKNHDVSPHTLL